jgi:phosphinothricin acetyltransferase
MLKKIDIRSASYQDLPRITEILNQAISWGKANAYTELFKTEDRKDWLLKHSGDTFTVFVAELNNRVEAYLSISPYREGRQAFRHTAEVSYYVDFDHHRKGIATALMEEALDYCRKAHIDILLAFLYDHNKTSVSFLEKHGFKRWGLLPAAARVGSKRFDHAIYGIQLINE